MQLFRNGTTRSGLQKCEIIFAWTLNDADMIIAEHLGVSRDSIK